MEKRLIIFIILLSSVSVFAQKTIQRSVFFENANAQLSTESQNYLRSLADTIKKYPKYSIALKGHTDVTGTISENHSFSQKRALVVKSELEKNGILPNNFTINAVGATEPVGDNSTDEGKKLNRRVEIAITIYPVIPDKKYQNIQELYQDLSVGYQNFKINTAKDTIIKGKKGTVLFVPKAAFDGVPMNAIVDFRLKEAYSVSDIISENLSTQSGDKLLETGGMIYIDAKYKGVDLTLKKTMNVAFASKESNQKDMQLFSGVRDNKNNGTIDWKPLNQDGEEEEVTLYKSFSGKFQNDLITDKNGYIKFKELIDTTGCFQLFYNKKSKTDLESINVNPLNKVQMAMLFTARQNPSILNGKVETLHNKAFQETYIFYNIESYSQLLNQNGESWDSLMAVRMAFVEKNSISEEEMRKRLIRAQFIQDSLKKEYDIWYAANKDRLEQEKKEAEVFNKTFPIKNLFWLNCDAYRPSELVNIQVDKPQSQSYNILFILKRDRMTIKSYANNNIVNLSAPKNKLGNIVGMKILDGQAYLAIHETWSTSQLYKLDYKPVTAEEIKAKLKELNF